MKSIKNIKKCRFSLFHFRRQGKHREPPPKVESCCTKRRAIPKPLILARIFSTQLKIQLLLNFHLKESKFSQSIPGNCCLWRKNLTILLKYGKVTYVCNSISETCSKSAKILRRLVAQLQNRLRVRPPQAIVPAGNFSRESRSSKAWLLRESPHKWSGCKAPNAGKVFMCIFKKIQ